jgi:hypothetical protein
MPTALQIGKQLLANYQQAHLVDSSHQKHKIEALLETRPKYKLLELEHPYYPIGKETAKAVKETIKLASMLIDCRVGDDTVRDELEKLRDALKSKGKRNPHLDYLLTL